jgi:SSS family solute:Na+ symporter
MDFVNKIKPNTSSEGLMWIGRIVTFVFMILAAIWAPQIDKFPTLWEYLQNALSYIAPPIVSLYVVGLFWKRANATGAFASIVIGVISAVSFFFSDTISWLPEIHFLYTAGIIFLLCSLINIVFSLLTSPPPAEKINEFTWSKSIYKKETEELSKIPLYQNYRFQSILLLLALVIILIIFW